MSEGSQDDDEDDTGRDPTPVFVRMDDFIPSKGDEERTEGDDQNASKPRDVRVDCVKKLSADNGVGCRPADTGDDIENHNCGGG